MLTRRHLLTAGLGGLGPLMPALAQSSPPAPNRDFVVLPAPLRSDVPRGQVEVLEFFWYACPYCFGLEPVLNDWLRQLPPWVSFRRVPVAFRPAYVPLQRLYYALEAMGAVESHHGRVFNAIHRERVPLGTDEQILAWAGRVGLEVGRLQALLNSFGVLSRAVKATQVQEAYGVESVPSFGVAGRFYVDTERAGEGPRLLRVVEYLATEARRGA